METLEDYIRNGSIETMAEVILKFIMNTRLQTFENVHQQIRMPLQFIEVPNLEKMSIMNLLAQPAEVFLSNPDLGENPESNNNS